MASVGRVVSGTCTAARNAFSLSGCSKMVGRLLGRVGITKLKVIGMVAASKSSEAVRTASSESQARTAAGSAPSQSDHLCARPQPLRLTLQRRGLSNILEHLRRNDLRQQAHCLSKQLEVEQE
jgi:hypothetical protein